MITYLFIICSVFAIIILFLLSQFDISKIISIRDKFNLNNKPFFSLKPAKVNRKEQQGSTIEDRLLALQSVLGTNYKAIIRVVGDNVEFEAFGEYPIDEIDKRTFG